MTKIEAIKDAQILADQSGQVQVVYSYTGATGNGWHETRHDYTNEEAFKQRLYTKPAPTVVTTVKPDRKLKKK